MGMEMMMEVKRLMIKGMMPCLPLISVAARMVPSLEVPHPVPFQK
jgi:hypothetical protein